MACGIVVYTVNMAHAASKLGCTPSIEVPLAARDALDLGCVDASCDGEKLVLDLGCVPVMAVGRHVAGRAAKLVLAVVLPVGSTTPELEVMAAENC